MLNNGESLTKIPAYSLLNCFGLSSRVIGIIFIKGAPLDLHRPGVISVSIAFAEEVANVIAGIHSIGKTYYPNDNSGV
jgi:hypothetical protein